MTGLPKASSPFARFGTYIVHHKMVVATAVLGLLLCVLLFLTGCDVKEPATPPSDPVVVTVKPCSATVTTDCREPYDPSRTEHGHNSDR
jgi:hypothetical protein